MGKPKFKLWSLLLEKDPSTAYFNKKQSDNDFEQPLSQTLPVNHSR